MTGGRRYPLADLVALLRLSDEAVDRAAMSNPSGDHRPSDNQARRLLNVGGSRWATMHRDGLTPDVAERLATQTGRHPAEVWPTWYDDEIAEHTRECAECGGPFQPAPRATRQKFCSVPCGHRHRARDRYRARYQTDPEFREAELVRRRRRYVEEGDYERWRQRRYNSEKRATA